MLRNKRKIQEVNAGSMADIAFLLLIFFLVVTTMGTDTGIRRVLPPWSDSAHKYPEIKRRNLLEIKINHLDEIWVDGHTLPLSELSQTVKRFISNPDGDPEKSEYLTESIDIIGKHNVSQGVVSIQNDRRTSYERYIEIQNELSRAFNELREEASQHYFHTSFTSLDSQRRNAIQKAVPIRISEATSVGETDLQQ